MQKLECSNKIPEDFLDIFCEKRVFSENLFNAERQLIQSQS